MTLYGASGQVVGQRQAQFNAPINTGHLAPGLYVLKVQNGQHVHRLKLLKQ